MIEIKNNSGQVLFKIENNTLINNQGQELLFLDDGTVKNAGGRTLLTINGKDAISIMDDKPIISCVDGNIINLSGQVIGKVEGATTQEEMTFGAGGFILLA
uniref:5-fold beta-flower protein n=1 Tax=Fulvivirga sp. TaxID=1931237 RepID=UPI00404B71A0